MANKFTLLFEAVSMTKSSQPSSHERRHAELRYATLVHSHRHKELNDMAQKVAALPHHKEGIDVADQLHEHGWDRFTAGVYKSNPHVMEHGLHHMNHAYDMLYHVIGYKSSAHKKIADDMKRDAGKFDKKVQKHIDTLKKTYKPKEHIYTNKFTKQMKKNKPIMQ